MKGLILVAILFAVAHAQININFAGLLNGAGPLSTPAPTAAPCTAVTCKPYLSLRRAIDAAHVRVAEKGLWTKIYVNDNDQWPNIVYNNECPPDASRFPFPAKEGAFGALLDRGLRIAYFDGIFSFSNGKTNPPTGVEINYINALVSEMRAVYGPFNTTWVPVRNNTVIFARILNGTIDLTPGLSDMGYWVPRNFSSEARSDRIVGTGCSAYLEPGMCVVLSKSPWKSYQDLVAAGASLRVGIIGATVSKLTLLPQAQIVNITISPDQFVDMMKMLVDGVIDVLWDAVVVASDVAGTNYKLEQFFNFSSGVALSRKLLTPLDK